MVCQALEAHTVKAGISFENTDVDFAAFRRALDGFYERAVVYQPLARGRKLCSLRAR
jgi:hypothetical protein